MINPELLLKTINKAVVKKEIVVTEENELWIKVAFHQLGKLGVELDFKKGKLQIAAKKRAKKKVVKK